MFKSELQVFERDAYEHYINTIINGPANEQELVEALQKFVPGSDIYDFLYLVTQQKLTGGLLSEKDKKLLKEYNEQYRLGW